MFDWIKIAILVTASPTRAIMRLRKASLGKTPISEPRYARMIAKWNKAFLGLAALLCAVTFLTGRFGLKSGYAAFAIEVVVFFTAWTRCNETVIAFGRDAWDKLDRRHRSNVFLPAKARLVFVIQSYAEIFLWFGLVACYLPSNMYNANIHLDILTAIYFSGATISTLGYGDIVPVHWISRFISLYEVFSGLFLIAGAITIYLSQSLDSAKSRY